MIDFFAIFLMVSGLFFVGMILAFGLAFNHAKEEETARFYNANISKRH